MSFQERRSLVNVISSILITVLYTFYMIPRYPQAEPYSPDIFHFWGTFFVILIPVAAVAKIIIYIIFYILNTIATREVEPDITDERDKLIEMKSSQISGYVFVIGFLLAMIAVAFGMPPAVMFILLFCAGFSSDIVSEISQFVFYRRGI
jgi:uncharacterized membrane protein YfcA